MADRYPILQRKLDDLRNLHDDAKKTHQAESARLKSDLARCQKTILDQTSQIDRQTKHADALEARVQDLKHAALADQSQIISLKAKLKAADRDSKLADLEKSLASETTRRVSLEAQLQNLRSKGDNDIQAARTGANQLASLQQELSNARESFSRERHAFISRLEHSSSLLSHAAQQYASLASTTVPSSTHRKLKRLYLSSEFKILRLERKLGNAEDQVNELAHLVRQVNDRNDLLKSQLADANYQLSVYETMLNAAPPPDTPQLEDLGWEPARIEEDLVVKASEARLSELLAVYYNLCSQQLLFAYTCLDKDLSQTSSLVKQQAKDLTSAHASHKSTAANLEAVQTERSSLSNQLTELQGTNATLKRICASLEAQVTSLQNQQQQLVLEHKAEMKKDKDVVQRLTSVAQKNKMAEDALRAEIDRLLAELAEAERYQEAYNSLSEQVNDLLARNQLAEEEAERLSKFNAEILGHSNPAQRIAYVDRIRRELAEAKHKIIVLTMEQETIVELNADLQHELDMYRSDKPIMQITRVQRVPLSNVTRSLNAISSTTTTTATAAAEPVNMKTDLDPIPGEMTLDESMQ